MRGKNAKLVNKMAAITGLHRKEIKRLWNATPRNKRHGRRAQMMAHAIEIVAKAKQSEGTPKKFMGLKRRQGTANRRKG